ncbi:MAG: type II toxin-antitoxin system prevent-host-death family antitoxin [Actinomycetota bacterium]|nr:type II toxin-antitoxin system prevent-host-death family antitoxin [Actinomycetota bacterium]
MSNISVRDLRNHGGEILERASHGEPITITRDGKPVAQLVALPAPAVSAETLVARRRHLPPVDPERLRVDIDATVDPQL